MTFTHALATNRYGEADLIVSTSAANGTHTTLASAMAAAVSGQTIFIRDSITENVTLTPGVNLAAWTGGTLNTPTIIGTLTMTAAGTCTIRGLRLQTNSAAIISITGANASIININECYLNCTNNTGISNSGSNAASKIDLNDCTGDIGTTGIGLFAVSNGTIRFNYCTFSNSGATTTASTVSSAASLSCSYFHLNSPITSSNTASVAFGYSDIDTSVQNVSALNVNGTGGTNIYYSRLASGSATPLTIGTGATAIVDALTLTHTNAAAVSGLGALTYSGIFQDTTVGTISPTTILGKGTVGINNGTAPVVGYIGEIISSNIASASGVSLTNNTPANVTSISVTAGTWIIYGSVATTGLVTATYVTGSVNSTSATPGTMAVNTTAFNQTGTITVDPVCISPPLYVTLSGATTYYLVAQAGFTVGTVKAFGRIQAIRIA